MSFLLLTLQPRSSIKKVNPSSTLFHFSINRKKLKVVSYTIEQSYIGAKGTYKLYVSIVCIAMKLLFVVVVVVVCLVNIQPVESCNKNSQCPSRFCIGGTFWRSGKCAAEKRPDGVGCHNGDGNSCVSGQCTCKLCGRKQDNLKACSTDDNCYSGNCQNSGSVTWGCNGVCHPVTTCEFREGGRSGGWDTYIGFEPEWKCKRICKENKVKNTRINGITTTNSLTPQCWCNSYMTSLTTTAKDKRWLRTCFLV